MRKLLQDCIVEAETQYDLEVEAFFMFDGSVWIKADEEKLVFVFRQLFKNAVEATIGQCLVVIKVRQSRDELVVEISDNGEGISEGNLNKVFEPFFSTKLRALGIGLTQVQRIVSAHKGNISIRNNDGTGASVLITLPF